LGNHPNGELYNQRTLNEEPSQEDSSSFVQPSAADEENNLQEQTEQKLEEF
jgi:hypothetical protein